MTEAERRNTRADWPVRKFRLGEEPSDFEYWRSRPPEERLAALAQVREEFDRGHFGLSPDFNGFIRLMNEHGARYLVVGGYAVAFHGHPRYTKDLDVWIDSTPENASRVVAVLDSFGFRSLELSIEDFTRSDAIVQLGRPPNRIDLLTTLAGVSFDACYTRRVVLERADGAIPFIDLDCLRQNKRAAGRLQDRADLENLE